MGVGAKKKGYIKNKNTGEVKSFMFNPEAFSDSRAVTFAEIGAPGSSYPKIQYIKGGARALTLDLFLSKDCKSSSIASHLSFLEKFLPKSGRFSKPPILIFAMGKDVRECILMQLDRNFLEFNSNLDPTQVTLSLSLVELG